MVSILCLNKVRHLLHRISSPLSYSNSCMRLKGLESKSIWAHVQIWIGQRTWNPVYRSFTTSCNTEGKSLKCDVASLIDQRILFQSPYLDCMVTVNKYHNESVCGRLSCRKPYSRIMLSGVAGSGKTPVKWLEDVWPVIYGVITKSDNTYIYRYTSSYSILTQWYYYHHLQYIVLSLV